MTDSAEASTATTRPGRRGLGIAVTGCVLSGAVALFAVGRIWLHYTVPRSGLADLPSRATGHAVAGAAATLALVVLAGVVVLPATRGLGRRIAGAVIALAGLGMGYLAVLTIARTTDQLPDLLRVSEVQLSDAELRKLNEASASSGNNGSSS